MLITVIAVPLSAQHNLVVGMEQGVWGFTKRGKGADALAAGVPVLLGTNYRNTVNGTRQVRISKDDYHNGVMESLVLARATGPVQAVPDVPLWPREVAEQRVIYGERFPLSVLGRAQNVNLGAFPRSFSDAFHGSINEVGTPVTVDLPSEVLDQLAQSAGLGAWPVNEADFSIGRGGGDAEELAADLASIAGTGKQPRYESDAAVRKAVERRSVDVALAHYRSQNWTVEELGKPYDILCTRADGKYLRVEVKGTRGPGARVELTINEVDSALHHPSELFVVRNIEVVHVDGVPLGRGGEVRILHDWKPEGHQPIRFTYELPWETDEVKLLM